MNKGDFFLVFQSLRRVSYLYFFEKKYKKRSGEHLCGQWASCVIINGAQYFLLVKMCSWHYNAYFFS